MVNTDLKNNLTDTINMLNEVINSQEKLKNEEELPYLMDIDYGQQNWNVVSALREFISNAKDVEDESGNTSCKLSYEKGYSIISDNGTGLSKESFIMGKSSKVEQQSKIGQHGEGGKMSYLTLLRNNRKFWIETVGFSFTGEITDIGTLMKNNTLIKSENENSANLMKLRFFPNNKKIGTTVYVKTSEQEFIEAKNLFLDLGDVEKVDNNIYLPAGNIYIVGLKTSSFENMIFSYNIHDKTMSNRDRNMVDAAKINNHILNIINNSKNQKFIKEYMTKYEDIPNAYEYQFTLNPKNKESWVKVMNKIFPKACVSSDIKSDLHASMMGYQVLRNIPTALNSLLLTLGMHKSDFYAKNYKGEGIKEKNKIIFPVTEDYVSNWDKIGAIREVIQNSLDAGNKVRIIHDGEKTRISDDGIGIAKKHFVFGVSEKSDTAIGKWGEGLKVACLILSRTNSDMKIETVGYTYEPKLEMNEEFGLKLLVIYYTKNSRTKGTSITFKCTEKELETAKSKFLNYKETGKRKVVKTDEVDVYMDVPGIIYSNGLETQTVNAIFGYNVKNKDIVSSRDRNSVNIEILTTIISRFISQLEDEQMISEILTKWQNGNANQMEYVAMDNRFFVISPRNITIWNKIIKKLYSKTCFSVFRENGCDKTNDDDFIAKSAGYKLLYDVPYCIKNLLINNGVVISSTIAKKYRNGNILIGDKIIYPITKTFASDWTVEDAIKELISNSIDTDSKTSFKCDNGVITISDKGEGIQKKNLLFDASSKDETKIGTFGEGLKIASLVLARNSRNFRVVTKGYQYTATIKRDAEFRADVLVVEIEKNKKRIGTDISFKGTEPELEKAKSCFLSLNNSFKELCDNIYEPAGSLFVNGVFIQKLPMLFSYNIVGGKEIINRDRKSVEIEKTKTFISKYINKCSNKKVIEKILKNTSTNLESGIFIKPDLAIEKIWKQVALDIYKNSCFVTGTEADGVAQDRGFNLLNNFPSDLRLLLMGLGIPLSSNAVVLKGDEKQIKKRFDPNKLSEKGKKRFSTAKSLFQDLYGLRNSNKIELIETFNEGIETDSIWGLYNSITDTIYVLAKIVDNTDSYSFETLMGVLIHEQVHRISGATDRTRDFEMALSLELGRISTLLLKATSDKQRVHII